MTFYRTLGFAPALVLLAASAARAQQPVASPDLHTITTAVPVLTLSPDARGSSLGEAGVATSPDANAAFYNAGKLGFEPYRYGISVNYSPWLRNITDDMWIGSVNGYAKVTDRGTLGASLNYFSLGNIYYRTIANQPNGEFSPKEYNLTLSYGQKLSDHFGLGISARYIRSNLTGNSTGNDSKPGNAFAADLGAYYSNDLTVGSHLLNLSFGGAISNIGNKMTYTDATTPSFLPTSLRLGTALTYELDEFNKLTLAFDATKLLVPSPYYEDNYNPSNLAQAQRVQAENQARREQGIISGIFNSFSDAPGGFHGEMQEINLSTGLEYWYNNLVAGRVGYFYENPHTGNRQYLSFGLGARFSVIGIDGTYLVPNSNANPLAQTIRVSLHLNLDKLEDALSDQGAGGTRGTL